ncbi:MAG: YHS domain-containing protein [Thermoanaerobaculia bacterium]
MKKDAVCGMDVKDTSPHNSAHAGQTYVFCCASCKATFDKEPARYVAAAGGSAKPGGHHHGCC